MDATLPRMATLYHVTSGTIGVSVPQACRPFPVVILNCTARHNHVRQHRPTQRGDPRNPLANSSGQTREETREAHKHERLGYNRVRQPRLLYPVGKAASANESKGSGSMSPCQGKHRLLARAMIYMILVEPTQHPSRRSGTGCCTHECRDCPHRGC